MNTLNMFSIRLAGIFALAALPALAQQGGVQTARHAASSGAPTISGTVLSASTGQPLAEAEVALLNADENASGGAGVGAKQESTLEETTTDAEGHFVFAHLPAGRYHLQAEHAGYVQAGFQSHGSFQAVVVAGPNLATEGLRVELKPLAALYGVVSDDAGDMVAQATVSLYHQDDSSGQSRIVHTDTRMTDDLGHYEFPHLQEGTYFLSVTAKPWYAVDTGASYLLPMPGSTHLMLATEPQPDAPHSPLDVAYATTYYPDATDSDSATPIPLKAGDRTAVNFGLHAVPSAHMKLSVPKDAEGHGPQLGALSQQAFGESIPVSDYSADYHDAGDHVVIDISSMAPGQYELTLHDPSTNTTRDVVMDATNGSGTITPPPSAGLAEVTGKIDMSYGDSLPASMNMSLWPRQDGAQMLEAPVKPDGSFHIAGVPAGDYELAVSAGGSRGGITQMGAQGAPVNGGMLQIGSGAVTLVATAAMSSSEVKGFVRSGAAPVPGALVVLVPGGPDTHRALFRAAESATDGSFSLTQVVPGSYTVIAIADGWELEWTRAAVIDRYLPLGAKITAPAHGNVSLPEALALQPR